MRFDTIFFDLDSTLYPESNGLWQAIRKRIDLFLLERMGFPPQEIPKIRQNFFQEHGTTLRGLQIHHNVDAAEYLDFVHDLPLDEFLQPAPRLRQILRSIPSRRWVFTNSDANHASRVLAKLGLEDCFEGMIDVWKMQPHCKPQPGAYEFAMDFARAAAPEECALLDDSAGNLAPAHEMGFFTVLVGQNGSHPSASRSIEDILDLPEAVPEFWV